MNGVRSDRTRVLSQDEPKHTLMIANQNENMPARGLEPGTLARRTLIGGALAALFTSPRSVLAEDTDTPNNPFILLLTGVYQPVVHGPNLGLSSVNLSDGSYSTTKIYPIFGVEGSTDQDKAIGDFYVQVNGNLCAYHLPGGAIAMRFNPVPLGAPAGFNGFVPFPDGMGGTYLEGTFELTILEATGIYHAFAGGHNHMVDRLHQLANGSFDEFCFCNISQYQFP
jgi:hypothetical protein